MAGRNAEVGRSGAIGPLTRGPRSAGHQRLERMSEGIIDRRSLESAVRHAVVATGVASDAVTVPLGILHQGAVGGGASPRR